MSTILEKIVDQTREDLARRKRQRSWKDLTTMPGMEKSRAGFRRALKSPGLSIIAEVKRASPSKGVIREPFEPLEIAAAYERGGAAALSVLTDKPFFRGELSYLEAISTRTRLPLLRKDFIVDPYQILEAKAFGADAVLLIVAVTSGSQLDELLVAASELGVEALVECYGPEEMDSLDWKHIDMVGVNNRDLKSFEVDLHRGVAMLSSAPEGVVTVSESGLSTTEDLAYLLRNRIDAALIGEHFMRQPDPGEALLSMVGPLNQRLEEERAGGDNGEG